MAPIIVRRRVASSGATAVTVLSRLGSRLRKQALRWYEILLCAVLLALALSVAAPGAEPDAEAVQCGNIQSSPVVMKR